MLQEVLHMREWLAILARRAGRREPRKSPLCQLQAATTDRGDTGIADERRQMLGEVFTQPTSRCGNGWWVGLRSSLPRQQSPKRRFQRVPNRHKDVLESSSTSSFARKLGLRPSNPCSRTFRTRANPRRFHRRRIAAHDMS